VKVGFDMALDNDMTPVKFFFSVTEQKERVWDGNRWKRVSVGHYLTAILGPVLKTFSALLESAEPPEEKRKRFREAIDTALPSPPFYNVIDKRAFLESLLTGFSSIWPYGNRHHTAREAFQEWERTQSLKQKKKVWPALPYLQGSWRKCNIYPDIMDKNLKPLLGWIIEAPTPWDAAACEVILMIVHNVRNKLNLCPKCFTFHWEKDHHICRECRREKEREKKAEKLKTPKTRFLNLLSQDKTRGKLTEEQIKHLKAILEKQGTKAAKAERQHLKEKVTLPSQKKTK
jgi:hypothetical protein